MDSLRPNRKVNHNMLSNTTKEQVHQALAMMTSMSASGCLNIELQQGCGI